MPCIFLVDSYVRAVQYLCSYPNGPYIPIQSCIYTNTLPEFVYIALIVTEKSFDFAPRGCGLFFSDRFFSRTERIRLPISNKIMVFSEKSLVEG